MVKRYKNGWCFRFSYRDAYGTLYKPFKSGFKTKKEAEQAELYAKDHIEETLSNMMLLRGYKTVLPNDTGAIITPATLYKDLFDVYLQACKEKGLSEVTIENKQIKYEKSLKISPPLADYPIGKINEMHLQVIVNACSTPCVQNDMYRFLHAMFEFAIKKSKHRIRENPAEFINRPKYVVPKKEYRGIDFVDDLLSRLKSQNSKLYPAVLLARLFGATREEIPPLEEERDLDPANYTIKFHSAVVRTVRSGNILKTQKTPNRVRTAYANKDIFDELHWFKQKNNITSKYLCCNFNGSMMLPKTLDTEFSKFIKNNNLPHCTFHQLRTILRDIDKQLGIDISTSADSLGHGNINVTRKYYETSNPILLKDASIKRFQTITVSPQMNEAE